MEKIIENFEKAGKIVGIKKTTIMNYTNKIIDWRYTGNKIQNLSPSVVEETPSGNLISYDIYTRLLKDRVMFFGHPVMDEVTNVVIAQLLFLEMTDSKKDITMYLNSPGGSCDAGLSVVNTMQYITPDVSVVAIGMAASMGAVLLACGAKGKRFALKDTRVMIHQPSGSMNGKSSAIEIDWEEMKKVKKRLYELLAEQSGQTFEAIEAKSKEDFWMSAAEAKSEGFIDEVLEKRPTSTN